MVEIKSTEHGLVVSMTFSLNGAWVKTSLCIAWTNQLHILALEEQLYIKLNIYSIKLIRQDVTYAPFRLNIFDTTAPKCYDWYPKQILPMLV